MRRFVGLLVAGMLAVGLLGVLPVAAGAQTGDLAAFCAARIDANGAQSKSALTPILEKMTTAAPAGISSTMVDFRALFKKKGQKAFDTEQGAVLTGLVDVFVFENCPGTKVGITAADYEFTGVPKTLPAGLAQFELTNTAPKENHEMAILRLTPAGQGTDLMKVLGTPEKHAAKFIDDSKSAFMYAPAGKVGYTPINLEPGTYAYACFVPQGGKQNGKLHYTLGMNGTFTVQ